MNLSELKTGQYGSVLKVNGESALRKRLMEIGFFKGSIVTVVRYAPLKDPIVYNVLRSEIAIRKEVACMIDIKLLETSYILSALQT